MPHSRALGTPITHSPMPMSSPNPEFSSSWVRNSRLRRLAASSNAAVVFCRSYVPVSRIKRFRRSSRFSRMNTTKISTMPVVVSGWISGVKKARSVSRAPGRGGWTSTGIGLLSAVAEGNCAEGLVSGLSSSLPSSWRTSAARESTPVPGPAPFSDAIFSRIVL